jgi:hypothetical protein
VIGHASSYRATAEAAKFTIALRNRQGYLFPALSGCDLVPFNSHPPDPLLAIATDLLAQTEAQHRTASRLEQTVRHHSRVARDRAGVGLTLDQMRAQIRAMRDLFDAERGLLDELERELAGANR